MRIRTLFMSALAVFAASLLLISCAREYEAQSACEILFDVMKRTDGLPYGIIYRSDASEGEESYMSSSLLLTLYGEDASSLVSRTDEFAVYLSSFEKPYEIAVFKCFSVSDAYEIAAMCLSRAERLRVLLHSTDWRALADSARVEQSGRVVVMTVTGQTQNNV